MWVCVKGTGDLIEINLEKDRPITFDSKESEIQWERASAINALKLKEKIDSGNLKATALCYLDLRFSWHSLDRYITQSKHCKLIVNMSLTLLLFMCMLCMLTLFSGCPFPGVRCEGSLDFCLITREPTRDSWTWVCI